jgi:hypothetical protein
MKKLCKRSRSTQLVKRVKSFFKKQQFLFFSCILIANKKEIFNVAVCSEKLRVACLGLFLNKNPKKKGRKKQLPKKVFMLISKKVANGVFKYFRFKKKDNALLKKKKRQKKVSLRVRIIEKALLNGVRHHFKNFEMRGKRKRNFFKKKVLGSCFLKKKGRFFLNYEILFPSYKEVAHNRLKNIFWAYIKNYRFWEEFFKMLYKFSTVNLKRNSLLINFLFHILLMPLENFIIELYFRKVFLSKRDFYFYKHAGFFFYSSYREQKICY